MAREAATIDNVSGLNIKDDSTQHYMEREAATRDNVSGLAIKEDTTR